MFTADDFIEEAHQLAKPCVYLVPPGEGDVVATWGGDGVVPPPEADWGNHYLSVDCRLLPQTEFSLTGWLSLYVVQFKGRILHDAVAHLSELPLLATPLYARKALFLPPPVVVFRSGSDKIQAWLQSIGWQPEWKDSQTGPGRDIVAEYEQLYLEQPFVRPKPDEYAYLGGYNFLYGLYPIIEEGRSFVLSTLKGGEPWLGVWREPDGTFDVVHQFK